MRKKLLLVIKDQLEFRLLVNDVFLPGLLTRFDVALMCPANSSELFRARVLERYPQIRFVDSGLDSEVGLVDRAIYWLKNQLFFILNAGRSETCLQKVFLSLELPLRAVCGRILEDKFARILSPLFSGAIARNLVRSILRMVSVPLMPARPLVLGHRRFYSPVRLRERFDYILFGRPNAFANIAIQKAHAAAGTKIVTLCRNFDVPASKGIFTVPSDYTIVFDRALAEHLRALNGPENYGKVVLYDHPVRFLRQPRKSDSNGCLKILYAANGRVFVPGEQDIVWRLYSFLSQEYGGRFRLFVRPHPTDYGESDRCERFAGVLKKPNVFLESRYGQFLDGRDGRKLFFPCPRDADQYYARLQEMDLVLSSFSTINYEARLLGVNTAFLSLDRRLDWLARRDHLRLMIERHDIPVLTSLDGIRKYLL